MLTIRQIEDQYPENLRPFKRNLLREYIQYKIIEILYTSQYASKLVFLGGTALRIIYGNRRFSEDLDFDNVGLINEEFIDISRIVAEKLTGQGFEVETRLTAKNAFRCKIKLPKILFENELSPLADEKLMVQIDTIAHNFDYESEQKILNKFDVFTSALVTPPSIILAQKMYAVINRARAKGRDFYDIVFLLSFTSPHYGYISYRLNITNAEDLRQTLLAKIVKLNFKELARDVSPFLFFPSDARKVELFPEFIKQANLS